MNPQTVKKSKHQLWLAKFTQTQVHISVHGYADTRFPFIFKNSRYSKHFVAHYRSRQHKSPQTETTVSTYAWEAGAEMKSSDTGERSG